VTCRELLDELAEKLQSKLSFTPEQTLDTVADLLTFLRVVPITGKLKVIPADPDDDKVLECATVGAHISSKGRGICCRWVLFGDPHSWAAAMEFLFGQLFSHETADGLTRGPRR
jgi:hypothetical protein